MAGTPRSSPWEALIGLCNYTTDQMVQRLKPQLYILPTSKYFHPHSFPYLSLSLFDPLTRIGLLILSFYNVTYSLDVQPSYSNLGFALSGRVIERIVQQRYEDFIVENILTVMTPSLCPYHYYCCYRYYELIFISTSILSSCFPCSPWV